MFLFKTRYLLFHAYHVIKSGIKETIASRERGWELAMQTSARFSSGACQAALSRTTSSFETTAYKDVEIGTGPGRPVTQYSFIF